MRKIYHAVSVTLALFLLYAGAAHFSAVAYGLINGTQLQGATCAAISDMTTDCTIVVASDIFWLSDYARFLNESPWRLYRDNLTLPIFQQLSAGTMIRVNRREPNPRPGW